MTHVVLNRRDLRVLLRAAEAALKSDDEEHYLFIYPKSPRLPFALVSKPAYDAITAQGSQPASPLEGGIEGGQEPPMP